MTEKKKLATIIASIVLVIVLGTWCMTAYQMPPVYVCPILVILGTFIGLSFKRKETIIKTIEVPVEVEKIVEVRVPYKKNKDKSKEV